MNLHYESYPKNYLAQSVDVRESNATPIIIIPGLFGSTANWRGIAKKLSDDRPIIVIDQRNHGRSPHADTNSYLDMVDDLHAFIEQHEIPKVILCGHSMGGKVAMLFALLHSSYVAKLAILDIAPVTYEHSHAPFLEELLNIDLSQLQSRKDADRALTPVITDMGTRMFLLQSLAGTAGSFFWRINLSVLHDFMPQLVGFPDQIVSKLRNNCETVVIIGNLSNYVSDAGYKKLTQYFENSNLIVIDQAGHWLHAEQPAKVLEQLQQL